jgi:hypothetical protein
MSEAIPSDAPAFLRELVMRLQRGTLARLKRISPGHLGEIDALASLYDRRQK